MLPTTWSLVSATILTPLSGSRSATARISSQGARVHGEVAVEALDRGVQDAAVDALRVRQHECPDRPEHARDLFDDAFRRARVGEVGFDREGTGARRLDLPRERERVGVGIAAERHPVLVGPPVAERDIPPVGGQGEGDRVRDAVAPAGAGHERDGSRHVGAPTRSWCRRRGRGGT
jgi:hypothetical protein